MNVLNIADIWFRGMNSINQNDVKSIFPLAKLSHSAIISWIDECVYLKITMCLLLLTLRHLMLASKGGADLPLE